MNAISHPPIGKLSADEAEIRDFVSCLFRYAEPGTLVGLRSFAHDKADTAPRMQGWPAIEDGNASLIAAAVRAATQSANSTTGLVFAPPVATFWATQIVGEQQRARESDLANGLCISVEIDEGDIEAARRRLEHLLGPATVIVESGGEWIDPTTGEIHKKLHLHWRLSEPTRMPEDHAKLKDARRAAMLLVGADATTVPLVHPLRWPGSWHCKSTPRLAKIATCNQASEVHLDEALAVLEEAVEAAGIKLGATSTGPRNPGEPQAAITRLTPAVMVIPNLDTTSWDDWNRMGLLIHRATGGTSEGLELWIDWSQKSGKYIGGECQVRWDHFHAHPFSKSGAGTIFYMAKVHGWSEIKTSPKLMLHAFDKITGQYTNGLHAEQASYTEHIANDDEPVNEDTSANFNPEPRYEHETATGFIPLGHDHGRFYFYSRAGGQVRDFLARELQTFGSLVELAPLQYWETHYPGRRGANFKAAGDLLIALCHTVGIYNNDRLRGRGAWLDGDDSVLHCGDRLLVNGCEAPLTSLGGYSIYEQAQRLKVDVDAEPLSDAEASRLIDLCLALPLEDPESMGRLLAGWCVIAPVCGAMPWRPHLWLTSESGAGKSWTWDNIVRPLLGAMALRVQSKTTEAYLRQRLGSDALPVLFDEFETQNERDRQRVQQVLDLARQASSEDGAEIGKGGQDGRARSYRIRSCFGFASVNLGLSQAADESRTVCLTLQPSNDPAIKANNFEKLKKLRAEIMLPGFAEGLLARTLKLLPVIRANAEVFAQAIAVTAGRRAGDTIGVLLAGAWSLRSSKVATAEEAKKYVEERQWIKDAVSRSVTEPEWKRALCFLAQQKLRVTPRNGPAEDVLVGELLDRWAGKTRGSAVITLNDAELALTRSGIKLQLFELDGPKEGEKGPAKGDLLEMPLVHLATGSEQIKRWFAPSPWGTGWATTISRAPDVKKMEKTQRFGSLVSKGMTIPFDTLLGPDSA